MTKMIMYCYGNENESTTVRSLAPSSLAIVRAISMLLGAGLLYLLSDTIADPDLWGHVRFGQDILRSGHIVQKDPYSYLSGGQLWINHEWLAEVFFAMAYRAGGGSGLVLLKTAICLATLGLVWHHVARQGMGMIEGGLLTLIITGSAVPWMMALRPQIFSYFCFTVVLLALDRAARGRLSGLVYLPAVFAMWANLHGGFLAGLVVLIAWTGGKIAFERPPLREVVLTLSVLSGSLFAVLTNPYGWTLLSFLLRTATVRRPEIDDWQPLRPFHLEGMVYMAAMILTFGVIVISRRRRDYPLLLVLAIVVAGPFAAHRHIFLAMLAMALFMAGHAADVRARFVPPVKDSSSKLAWPIASIIAALSLVLVAAALPHFASIRMTKPAITVPARAIATLKAAGIQGNLAVPFSWGEYVIWHLGPLVKVSVDGRRETVYPENVYTENLHFQMGWSGWDHLVRRPETDLILTDRAFKSDRLMDDRRDWVVVYEDELCRIFARSGSELAETIRGASITAPPNEAFPC